jgi:apolipoprotein N-acyltransferase
MKNWAWLLSGILLGLSFPSYDSIPTGILAWFAFVPFLLANKEIQPFKIYLLKACLFIIVALFIDVWWVNYYSFQALLVCVFSQLPFLLLPLLVFYFVQKRFGWKKALLLLPFVWTLGDWLANNTPHGLQVYLLAYTQANNTWLIQFADTFGMWGVGFWLMGVNCLIVVSLSPLTETSDRPRGGIQQRFKFPLWGTGGFFLLPFLYSFYVLVLNPKSVLGSDTRKSKVSLIQTNLDSYSKDSLLAQKTLDQIISLSDSAVRTAQPDLIVLPEAALPIPLFQDTAVFNFTKKAITAWQTSVAIGFVEYPDTSKKYIFRNNALVFTPQLAMFWDSLKLKANDVKVYQKQYGLPFVELMPYFEESPTLRGSAMQRGNEPYTFDYANFNGDKFKVALTICWEQMYPHKMAALVNDDAEFIALMNNDAWFGKTPGAKQLRSFTRMRAIENRRTIARCSNGGISCFIDPFGKISGEIPWFTHNISTQEVLCVTKKSFYTKHPNWFPIFSGIALVLLISIFQFQTNNKLLTHPQK